MSLADPASHQSPTRPPRGKPALKLIKTHHLPREDWLQLRQQGIGSSDAAAAVGLHPYKSPLQLWLEKTGRATSMSQPDPQDESSPMYWGTLLEPIVAAHYTKRTGHRVRRVNAVLQHPDMPWMLANIDREVIGIPDVQILECKTAGIQGSRLWKDGVPEYVQLQVLHQLAVTGKQAADVAVLLGGQELQVHRIQRDEEMIAHLIDLEASFWRHVQEDHPPPADGSESSAKALLALFPKDSGTTLNLQDDLVMNALFSDYLDARHQVEKFETLEAQFKQSLQQRMGHATRMLFEQGSVTWKQAKDASVLDAERLVRDHPDIAQRYQKVRAGGRRFLVVKEPSSFNESVSLVR
ncbi:YqaJ viral recombinase family protein [Hydrogenophaga taeniospiralis]|uniref:YqaJ viral recombinase family nuclease n=1 Tax=Hydrogenophaga taeniospiralis TaxID=65656 RepID=UPI001CFA51AB|nr:YqaJ viral recombinase family protein [Hydrogenophaga taeniospiralis]UCU95212.1 YqaJ viral recombinase family protein [Hydrogenophaga taeniospiralis]